MAMETARKSYLPEGMPTPEPQNDNLDKPYWDGAREHRLMIQHCNDCNTWLFGPEWCCWNCQSFNLEWVEVPGRGRVYSWERVWHPVHAALKEACPYLAVLVELPDYGNVRMLGNLLGDPLQEINIGDPVEVDFEDHDHYTLVHWRKNG